MTDSLLGLQKAVGDSMRSMDCSIFNFDETRFYNEIVSVSEFYSH